MLSKKDVARILNVSERTIGRLMESGELPYHKIKWQVRFKQEDIEKYLEKTRNE